MRGISMHKFSTQRLTRAAIGLAAVSAFALAPVAAQATGDSGPTGTDTSGVLAPGSLTFGSFDTTLTGVTQTVHTTVGAWNITDARGSHAGYSVNVTASVPTTGTATLPDGSITIS